MVTPGVDCNIALSHPSINNGAPCGFLLDDSKEAGPAVSIQREAVRQDDGSYLDNRNTSLPSFWQINCPTPTAVPTWKMPRRCTPR